MVADLIMGFAHIQQAAGHSFQRLIRLFFPHEILLLLSGSLTASENVL